MAGDDEREELDREVSDYVASEDGQPSFPPAVVFPVTSLAILSSTAFPEVVSSLPAWPAFPLAASSFIDPSLPTSPSPLPPPPLGLSFIRVL